MGTKAKAGNPFALIVVNALKIRTFILKTVGTILNGKTSLTFGQKKESKNIQRQ